MKEPIKLNEHSLKLASLLGGSNSHEFTKNKILIHGDRGTGKTFCAMQIAGAYFDVATTQYFDASVIKNGPVKNNFPIEYIKMKVRSEIKTVNDHSALNNSNRTLAEQIEESSIYLKWNISDNNSNIKEKKLLIIDNIDSLDDLNNSSIFEIYKKYLNENDTIIAIIREKNLRNAILKANSILDWKNEEIQTITLNDSNEKNIPIEPKKAKGANPTIRNGLLDLEENRPSHEETADHIQKNLHALLQESVCSFRGRSASLGNEHPRLVKAVEEYGRALDLPLEDINVPELWYRGNLLAALDQTFGDYTGGGMSTPMEPDVAAELSSLVTNHQGFILGFALGRELAARILPASPPPPEDVKAEADILTTFADSPDRVEPRFARLLRAMAEAITSLPLQASAAAMQVMEDARALVRNMLIATGRFLLIARADPVGASIIAGFAMEAAKAAGAATLLAADLGAILASLEPSIMAFAAFHPDLREWIVRVLSGIGKEH